MRLEGVLAFRGRLEAAGLDTSVAKAPDLPGVPTLLVAFWTWSWVEKRDIEPAMRTVGWALSNVGAR